MAERPSTDWEAIEGLYRGGLLSLREIAREHGVSDTAIRKKAKAEGWERDLTEKVKARVRTKLVRTPGSQPLRMRTDAELVEEQAETTASVLRLHRKDIAAGRDLVATLLAELQEGTADREEVEKAVEQETAGDANGTRRAAMLRAVALPSRAVVIKDLSAAMKNLVGLERQAFSIDGVPEESGDRGPVIDRPPRENREQWDARRQKEIGADRVVSPARPPG